MSLTFEHLSAQNAQRAERWHGPAWLAPDDPWTLADWSNAMCGEAGEAANVVKKLRRIETALWDAQKYPGDSDSGSAIQALKPEFAHRELLRKLANELADVVTYADLLATKAGLDLGQAVRDKFNRVSEAQDFPERL